MKPQELVWINWLNLVFIGKNLERTSSYMFQLKETNNLKIEVLGC